VKKSDGAIQKGLERDASLIQERVPERLTPENVRGVADSLRVFMSKNNLSGGRVAELLGVSRTMVTKFLGAGYRGDIVKLCNKVVHLVNSTERKNRHADHGFVETTVVKKSALLSPSARRSRLGRARSG